MRLEIDSTWKQCWFEITPEEAEELKRVMLSDGTSPLVTRAWELWGIAKKAGVNKDWDYPSRANLQILGIEVKVVA